MTKKNKKLFIDLKSRIKWAHNKEIKKKKSSEAMVCDMLIDK
jgi:hypothetical protein